MAGLSKVFVIDPDDRARHQIRLGFAREGVQVEELPVPAEIAKLDLPVDDTPPGLIIIGGPAGLDIVRRVRAVLGERQLDVPIIFTGRGVRRTDAEQAGADEVVLLPTYLRDIVTVGRLLRDRPAAQREQLVGSLAETTGVFTLVRALSALGRSAVLTLIRGLRRGEVRFYHGEVTSAQVGLIHGQAALHQLLLWTDARFDFHREDIVRRHQIPLDREELFADAERFLTGVRDSSGQLSPSMVLEQDMQRIQAYGRQIPTEVHGVLRMFDGHRVLADVLEDSPYRVFETLRVAQRAMDVGLLRAASQARKKSTWRAVLAIEEWLVGTEAPERDPSLAESGPLTQTAARESQRMKSKGGRKRKKRRANTPVAVTPSRTDIDWGALVPRIVGAEVGPLAGVVPASKASGEIMLPTTRDQAREGLESIMDTTQREKIFASDIGLEPSVVIGAEPSAPIPTVSDAARALAEAETVKLAAHARAAEAKAAAEKAAAEEKAAAAKAAEEKAAAEAKAAAEKAAAEEKVAAEKAAAEAKAAAAEAQRKRDEADALERARVEAEAHKKAKLEAEAAEKAAADAKAVADAKVAADAKAAADARPAADAGDENPASDSKARPGRETSGPVRTAREVDADRGTDIESAAQAAAAQAEQEKLEAWAAKSAASMVKDLVASEATKSGTKPGVSAPAKAGAKPGGSTHARFDVSSDEPAPLAVTEKPAALATESVVTTETPTATVTEGDRVLITHTEQTARLVAEPVATVTEAKEPTPVIPTSTEEKPATIVATVPVDTVPRPSSSDDLAKRLGTDDDEPKTTPFVRAESPPSGGAPSELTDEPSDGIPREAHTTVETGRVPPPRVPEVADDRPPDKTGEIAQRAKRPTPADIRSGEPSILVADIAAAQEAVAAVVAKQVAAPPSKSVETPARAATVEKVKADVAKTEISKFSEDEEAFFKQGATETAQVPKLVTESFEDLDEGYQPQTFWERLVGKKKPKPD